MLLGAPDPDMALGLLERILERAPDLAAQLHDPDSLARLVRFLGSARHAGEVLVGDPALVPVLLAEGTARRGICLSGGTAEALRLAHRAEWIRIAWRDLVLGADLAEVTRDLSDLADAAIEVALDLAQAGASEAAPLTVIAMGKLGGRELNYSSDIDIVFVSDDVDDPSARDAAVRVARSVVQTLGAMTDAGRLYRVDTRLRPEGASGPLVRGVAATTDYYWRRGRTWERQALVKARPVAGAMGVAARFLDGVRPFVYRRYLDAQAIADIQALRARIEGPDVGDVKTGWGGIRDTEFAVQFLQLVLGAGHPEVRETNTLAAISALSGIGALNADEAAALHGSYIFLRTVEHHLQLHHHRPVRHLPEEGPDLLRLARLAGFAGADAPDRFRSERARVGRAAREVLHRVLLDLLPEVARGAGLVADLVLDPDPPPEVVDRALGPYGLRDRAQAHRAIASLAEPSGPLGGAGRTRLALAGIAPQILTRVAASPDPDVTLARLERMVSGLGAKATFYQLMAEDPDVLDLLVALAAGSDYLAGILCANPGVVDELVDALLTRRPQVPGPMRAELAEAIAASDDPVQALFDFKCLHLLLAGVRDLGGRANLRATMAALSATAEALVAAATDLAMVDRDPRLAVLALGKLGGAEMNYASDLDLLFVHEGVGAEAADAMSRVARQVLRTLGGPTDRGVLYTVDARLRPGGSKGPLTVSAEALVSGEWALWERQALTKARPVAGDGAFGREVLANLHRRVYEALVPRDLAAEVIAMRRRLEDTVEGEDLKRGVGGILDIEFLVQALQIAHGCDHPAIREPSTFLALARLATAGLISDPEHRALLTSYQLLRTVEGRLHVVENRPQSILPVDPAGLQRLAQRTGYVDTPTATAAENLHAEYRYYTGLTRQVFERILGRLA